MDDYLSFAKSLAGKAGGIMLEHFKVGVDIEIKSDRSPVTVADKAISELVINEVKQTYPDHGVLGEEASYNSKNREYLWVCDPIDGTKPYSKGIPTNVFSLALVKSGQPIIAVVNDPYMKRLFTAVKSQGAFCNDQPIHVNSVSKLSDLVIGTSGTGHSERMDSYALHEEIVPQLYRHMELGSSVYEAMMVALGQFGAAVFPGVLAHDAAAASLIVSESGGKATDLAGKQQRYDRPINGAILSNGIVHEKLVKIISKFTL